MATGRVPTTANSPLTAKGDLFGYSTTQARVAVGSDGDTLVADSAATTGLRWQGNYAAGKNKIINGDFSINQRSFSSTTTSGTYGFDRWRMDTGNGGTATYSSQAFTAGTAPVSGYEGTNFARIVTASFSASNSFAILFQPIENVRTLAGQTATISFWAKANSGTPKIGVELYQNFGTGGSADANQVGTAVTLSTSWARYSVTISVPSIAGKTINANNALYLGLWVNAGSTFDTRSGSIGIQNNTFDIWGVQVEAGNVATAFQTATGTLQGEIALCQRYYYRTSGNGGYRRFGMGQAYGTGNVVAYIAFPVTMRTNPTAVEQSGTASHYAVTNSTAGPVVCNTVPSFDNANNNGSTVLFTTASGLTAGNATTVMDNTTSSAYLGWSAEL
jgi:predicted secreted protein